MLLADAERAAGYEQNTRVRGTAVRQGRGGDGEKRRNRCDGIAQRRFSSRYGVTVGKGEGPTGFAPGSVVAPETGAP